MGARINGYDLDKYVYQRRASGAGNMTTQLDDFIMAVTNTAAARTVTLATATRQIGRQYVIQDESGAAATNNITVATEGAETIDGGDTITIAQNYGGVIVESNGTNWFSRKWSVLA